LDSKRKREINQDVKDWYLDYKDREEENKLPLEWKKLRPSKDAINYRLPGSFK